jgi:hypothetical protein
MKSKGTSIRRSRILSSSWWLTLRVRYQLTN